MSIEVRIYNPSLELQGVIDEFSSLIWIRRYQTPGEFEIRTPYAAESKRLLIPENIVQKYDGNEVVDAGVIENIVMNANELKESFTSDRVTIPPAELERLVRLMENL